MKYTNKYDQYNFINLICDISSYKYISRKIMLKVIILQPLMQRILTCRSLYSKSFKLSSFTIINSFLQLVDIKLFILLLFIPKLYKSQRYNKKIIKIMGQVIETFAILDSYQSKKYSQINPSKYSVHSMIEYGTIVTHENKIGLLISQSICTQKYNRIKKQLKGWIDNNYVHSCNVIKYNLSTSSVMCSSSIDQKIIMEYGQGSISQFLQSNNNPKVSIFAYSQISEQYNYAFTNIEILNIIKLMMDAAEEQLQKNKVWIQFSCKNIRYFKDQKKFKYLYIPSLEQTHYSQTFFAQEKCSSQAFQMDKSCIYSMGMVLLSIFIEQDCSDCYNYQQDTFYSSIFQSKIQKMEQKLSFKQLMNIVNIEQSKIPKIFQQELAELIIMMLHNKQNRLSFLELKQKYYTLVKQTSEKYGLAGKKSTNNMRSVQQFNFKSENIGLTVIETRQSISNNSKTSLCQRPQPNNNSKNKLNSAVKFKQSISRNHSKLQNFNRLI